MDAARPAQAFGADDAEVLHIALRPAAFAANEVVQRWRQAFVAATKVGVHAHVPAHAAQECGFDEVVGEDVAADGVAPAQDGQAAAFGEGVDADDGVVSPVVAVFALPGGDATGDDGAVEGARELDGARQQGFAADEARHGLQEAEARFGVHACDHFDEGVGVHQAVGVKHDHVGVAAAPAAHEVFDVAGFAPDVLCAAAVPHG